LSGTLQAKAGQTFGQGAQYGVGAVGDAYATATIDRSSGWVSSQLFINSKQHDFSSRSISADFRGSAIWW
jgi:hypothetical protein